MERETKEREATADRRTRVITLSRPRISGLSTAKSANTEASNDFRTVQ